MVDVSERKTPEKIKEKILEALNDKPLNALEISKQIESNWSTAKSYVEEMVKAGTLREISLGNQNFYQKINEDTYFNIPLKKEHREMFKFIFSRVILEYQKLRGELPKKTKLAKITVEIIEDANLTDLPLVWYLYGRIPLMIVDPTRNYSTNYNPPNKEKLIKIIVEVVSKESKKKIAELKNAQYGKHNQELYLEKDKLAYALSKENNEKKILEGFKELYLKIDVEKNKESFVYFDKLYFFVRMFDKSGTLKEKRAKIMLTLENCWKLIALENFVDSLSYIKSYNKKELMDFYLGSVLTMQQNIVKVYLEDLEEGYLDELKESKLSIEALEARKVMEGWTGE